MKQTIFLTNNEKAVDPYLPGIREELLDTVHTAVTARTSKEKPVPLRLKGLSEFQTGVLHRPSGKVFWGDWYKPHSTVVQENGIELAETGTRKRLLQSTEILGFDSLRLRSVPSVRVAYTTSSDAQAPGDICVNDVIALQRGGCQVVIDCRHRFCVPVLQGNTSCLITVPSLLCVSR